MSQLAIWMAKESAELLSMECAAPGEYRVRYIPQHSGPVSFEVKLLGEALPGSPFTPNVLPCAMERLYVFPSASRRRGTRTCTVSSIGTQTRTGGGTHCALHRRTLCSCLVRTRSVSHPCAHQRPPGPACCR